MRNTAKILVFLVLMMVFAVPSYAQWDPWDPWDLPGGGIEGTITSYVTGVPPVGYSVSVYAVDLVDSTTYTAIALEDGSFKMYHLQDDRTYYLFTDCSDTMPNGWQVYVPEDTVIQGQDLSVSCF